MNKSESKQGFSIRIMSMICQISSQFFPGDMQDESIGIQYTSIPDKIDFQFNPAYNR